MMRICLTALLCIVSIVGPAAQTPSPPIPIRVGSGIAPPTRIKNINPVYPPEAQRARVQGVVIIEATIGADGRVTNARVIRSIPLLDAAALDAVRQWEYTPTIVDGRAVPVIITVTVNFTVQGASAPPPLPSAVVPPPVSAGFIRLSATRTTTPTGDQWLYWDISLDRARQLPAWDASLLSPPRLSAEEAIGIATDWMKHRNPDVGNLELRTVALSRIDSRAAGAPNRWYYRVDFLGGNSSVANPSLGAIVLLDGSILEPQTEPPAK